MRIQEILKQEAIDGLVCTDDLTALLVIDNCQQLGIKIPEQLKIIGYDGTQFIQNYYSQLTTVEQPIGELSDLLVDLLLQRITSAR